MVGSVGFRFKSKVRCSLEKRTGSILIYRQDESNTHFTLFEFKKAARKPKCDSEWEELILRGHTLKPCEYKRR